MKKNSIIPDFALQVHPFHPVQIKQYFIYPSDTYIFNVIIKSDGLSQYIMILPVVLAFLAILAGP